LNIIKEKSKVFQNENNAIEILLSKHYNQFHHIFFQNLENNKIGIQEEIVQQIRNILNSYRLKFDREKDGEIPKELNELIVLLRAYYKKANFDMTFFVNYFKDIREMNKTKKKFINNYPKNETETLNDIERKVRIIKDLNHYLNTQISDRVQINFDTKYEYYNNPYSELKFNYLIIEEDLFSEMNESKLKEYLSDKCTSSKLRRPLNSYIAYNYLPILCKGSCLKEAEFFNNEFEKWIINHINKEGCQKQKCIEIKENLDNIKSQIRSLYIKTCIFS
jgi:flagellin-specific chaperone FliS